MPELTVLLQLGQAIIAAILASSYGIIRRHIHNAYLSSAIIGGLFGAVAVISMLTPIDVGDGVFVDLRNLFIGVSFAYFGWFGGIITLLMSVTARLALGGDGAISGIVGMGLAGTMGYLWRLWVRPHIANITLSHLLLGGMITLSIGAVMLTPEPFRSQIIFDFGPSLALFYILGSLLLAGTLAREMALIDQANALLRAASTDPLTGLPNRRGMQDILAALAQSPLTEPGMAMICFDVDLFKSINDMHGHMAGDTVLCEITARVTRCLRAQDHLTRHGGDEFVAILTGLTNADAIVVAERCREAVSLTPLILGNAAITVTISIGAHWVPRYEGFEQIYPKADRALYAAKTSGRNIVCHFAEAA